MFYAGLLCEMKGIIMILSIWVTNNCNMQCDYCYEKNKGNSNMDISYIKAIINFIDKVYPQADSANLFIKFFGGEPLLNLSFIKEFIKTMHGIKGNYGIIRYSITTNGTLLNREVIDYLNRNQIECSISIDGYPDIHNLHRKMKNGNGSWDYIEDNLEYALNTIQSLSARITYSSTTVQSLYDSVLFLVKRGFKNINLFPDFFDQDWDDQSLESLKQQYFKIKEYNKCNRDVNISTGNYANNLSKGYIGCGGGFNTYSISVTGDIYPCTYSIDYAQFRLGSIFDIDNYKVVKHITDHDKRGDCKGCKYFYICQSGRCIYLNYKMSGEFYKTNGFFCEYQKLEYKYNGL